MKKFDSRTVTLQSNGMTFVESREIFDLFLEDGPDFAYHIGDETAIIEEEVFEKAVMRIASNRGAAACCSSLDQA